MIKDSYRKESLTKMKYLDKKRFFSVNADELEEIKSLKLRALDVIEVFENQIHAVHLRDKKEKQKYKLERLENVNPVKLKDTSNKTKEFRVTVLGDVELDPKVLTTLSKGPNLILPNNSLRRKKERVDEAEVGLERFFYGLRCKWHMDSGSGPSGSSGGLIIKQPEKFKSQPSPLHPKGEEKMKNTKAQILASYAELQKNKDKIDPITEESIQLIRDLKQRDDLVIKQSDKDKQLVIVPKETYIRQVEEVLSDNKTYEKIKKNPLSGMVNEIESLCAMLSTKYPNLSDKAKPHLPRMPEFYCVYKTHKEKDPPPLRPVTSQVDSPAERLGEITTFILQQCMEFVPTNLKDTSQFRSRLEERNKSLQPSPNRIMATADVKSLYTNVPVQHGLEVISSFVNKYHTQVNMLDLEIADFKLILKTVIEAGYFRFNDSYYRQKDGLGMGIKPAPPFAIIYVYCTVEKPLLENDFEYAVNRPERSPDLPRIEDWVRYVDDCWILTDGADSMEVDQLFNYVNALNPNIQFTHESSKSNIDFLDLTVHMDINGRLDYELFIKPSSLGIFLNSNSDHSQSTKSGSAVNEIRRAINNGSTEVYQNRGIDKVKTVLIANDFTARQVKQFIRKAKIVRTGEKRKTNSVLKLPFTNEAHKRIVMKILAENDYTKDTRVVFKPERKLKDILSRTSLLPTPCNRKNDNTCFQCDELCMTKNVVYKITCNICKQSYVGETGRRKRTRCWEHYQSAKNRTKASAMGQHFRLHHADMVVPSTPFTFEVLRKCNDFVDRLLWQSLYIKKISPALNKQLADNMSWNKNTWRIS